MKAQEVADIVISGHHSSTREAALLVAVSGIDGSGKSTLAGGLAAKLERVGIKTALIGLDAWHQPPEKRFGKDAPAQHFYEHAFRFDELFATLIDPLRRDRSIHLTAELTRLPQNDLFSYSYDLDAIDVIVLEGIFLFKRELRKRYDLAFWIECPFATALQRAVLRNQEGLSEDAIIKDYRDIYFPAQMIHLANDEPRSNADGIVIDLCGE